MITIGRTPRIAAAMAALSVNFALAAGLASLAHHYEAHALRDLRAVVGRGGASPASAPLAAIATTQAGSLRCRPERVAPG